MRRTLCGRSAHAFGPPGLARTVAVPTYTLAHAWESVSAIGEEENCLLFWLPIICCSPLLLSSISDGALSIGACYLSLHSV